MEAKKSSKADLEKRRGLYLELGLVAILAVCLVAFNIKSYDNDVKEVTKRTVAEEVEEVVLNTMEKETPPPPPEEPEVPQTELKIVDNDATITNEAVVFDADAKNAENTEIKPVVTEIEDEDVEETIYVVVEEEPDFPGGMEALLKYLQDNIQYPQLAKENNITGKVFVTFVVEKDGRVTQVKLLRDIGGGCGNEAMRVVKAMPKWKPGKQQGRPVRTQFNLPVVFNLRG
ncbi:MAG: energy transducer TonB [Bacteroidales bacterium]|nr:energy transducer TonB [Bacteroidales bacterium]